mmetsp:Transcript_22691/g.49122  ORF Transcript_22691/g.49122 Transcript_22691/m.49122 type:complete len:250 (+) Transcript_22691:734-1483(+)
MCSDSNHRFTCLPSTSASGEVVCCVIIFQRKTGEVPLDWRMGIDASVNPIRNGKGEITVSHNVGTGKFHPGGPKCNYFDAIELFPRRQCGPIPVIIVNGHQSQLNPSFIKYINNDAYRWVVCFGVLVWKFTHGLRWSIIPHDIMQLMNRIFHKAFGNVEGNKKAVSDRGWYLPSQKLLDHPSLVDDINEEYSSLSSSVMTLNVTQENGMAATVLDCVLVERARSQASRQPMVSTVYMIPNSSKYSMPGN